jgi:hypothetical protein
MICEGKAQNNVYDLLKTDTTGTVFSLAFRIKNSSLDNVSKISFYKSSNNGSSTSLLKEIFVSKNGDYYLLVDSELIYCVQDLFHTTISVDKTEYSSITNFSYIITDNNNVAQSYLAAKPN